LDSFNSCVTTDGEDVFDPGKHLDSLCEGGRIELIPLRVVDYKKGWAYIIEAVVNILQTYPITIYRMSADYGELEIRFDCYQRTQEVRVWRAIDHARAESRQTCMECGHRGTRMIHGGKIVVFCRDCMKKAEMSGETGTWLDRF
jgi:hypothetical protein